MGGVLSGTMGLHGHCANGLAALYLACGQDVACVAESAVGVTRFEVTAEGALYSSVTGPCRAIVASTWSCVCCGGCRSSARYRR